MPMHAHVKPWKAVATAVIAFGCIAGASKVAHATNTLADDPTPSGVMASRAVAPIQPA